MTCAFQQTASLSMPMSAGWPSPPWFSCTIGAVRPGPGIVLSATWTEIIEPSPSIPAARVTPISLLRAIGSRNWRAMSRRHFAELRVSRFILVGHSMGGKVAQFVASGHAAGLVGLVIVAPASAYGVQLPEQARERMVHAYGAAGSAAFVRDNILTKRPLPDDLRAQVLEDSLKVCEAARVAWPSVAIAQNIATAAASISVPTLVIGGGFDQVDPPPTLEKEVIGVIRTARLEIVQGSGHLLPLEAPKEVSTLINSFIAQL
jgi:pimeloyl-ACP methyl ester carboxylesterase